MADLATQWQKKKSYHCPERICRCSNSAFLHGDEWDPNRYVVTLSFIFQELAVCMEKLQLSQYISMFQENMIDGAILKELDTELLKTDFGFKGIEAIRLMKFAREGHIPK